jgi:uncharacterized membrane protein
MNMLIAAITFENVTHAWAWWLLVSTGAAWLYYTYRGIFERTERRLTWALMALRGAGLLALIVALAKPTWTRERVEISPGHVAIVLDNSVSMSLSDPSGPSRFALAVGAARNLSESLASPDGGPRLEVDLFGVDGARLADGIPEKPLLKSTDLVKAISASAKQLSSQLLQGIIVISDGMANTGPQDAVALGRTRVPIFTVGFQPDNSAGNLDFAVRGIQAPDRVIIKNIVNVDVRVSKTSGPATKASVVLKRGREEFASQTVAFAAGDDEQLVSLTFTPIEAGNFVYTASVAPAAPDAGEKLLANNARHFPLHVDADAIRVFYIEGFLRYEYKYLTARLKDDLDVSLVSVVRRGNPDRSDSAGNVSLITADRLEKFDVVILGDMEGSYLTAAECQALVEWVSAGHSLLLLGGYRSFGVDGLRGTPLADALPIVFSDTEPVQSEEEFKPQVTETGWRYPLFRVTGDRVQDEVLWADAPPLAGLALVKNAKPGADVLAVDPLLQIEGQPAVVAAAQRFGSGHTLVFAADTTWRWSRMTRIMGQTDTLYARFWSQTIRWLAGRDLEQKRSQLTVSTDRPDYETGKTVAIRVVQQPQPGDSPEPADVLVEVVDESGKNARPVSVRSGSADPNVFFGSFAPETGGRYEVQASLGGAGGERIANQTTDFLVHGPDLELADIGTNRPHLQSIAAQTGGEYFDIQRAGEIGQRIPRKERQSTRVESTELWDSPFLFLFFLTAVTIEWVLRRRQHLV